MKRIALVALSFVAICGTAARAALVSVANPNNVLAGATVTSSSQIGIPGLNTPNVNDGVIGDYTSSDNGLLFGNGDTDQRVVFSNFNSAINDIRIFGLDRTVDPERNLNQVTIYYSTTNQTSPNPALYTQVVPLTTFTGSYFPNDPSGATPGSVAGSLGGFVDYHFETLAGVQSLLFDFGTSIDPLNGNNEGDRVGEIQAFLPEPATLPFVALGAIALGLRRFRRRHAANVG